MSKDKNPDDRGMKGEARQESGATRRGGPSLEAAYQLVLWLTQAIEKHPRGFKFTLGDKTQVAALEVLENLITATFARDRMHNLSSANLGLERLRFLIRLANDLQVLDHRRYEHASRLIDDSGRLVGGWIKADRAAKT
ncbi:MAG: diversity-generating retroelement protein Avd [Alphaproteobacteria bacterium]|nr:diversity-generating retroelement protein Avd [Alphaproteobacteria bacterium]